jgi:hypothetical protein
VFRIDIAWISVLTSALIYFLSQMSSNANDSKQPYRRPMTTSISDCVMESRDKLNQQKRQGTKGVGPKNGASPQSIRLWDVSSGQCVASATVISSPTTTIASNNTTVASNATIAVASNTTSNIASNTASNTASNIASNTASITSITTTTPASNTASTPNTAANTTSNTAPSIQEVIETIQNCGWDDYNHRMTYLQNLLQKAREREDPVHDVILNTIQSEMLALQNTIQYNESKEFFCHNAEEKYGYAYVIQWIMSRWFMKCKTTDAVPPWYLTLCAHVQHLKLKDVVNETLVFIHQVKSARLSGPGLISDFNTSSPRPSQTASSSATPFSTPNTTSRKDTAARHPPPIQLNTDTPKKRHIRKRINTRLLWFVNRLQTSLNNHSKVIKTLEKQIYKQSKQIDEQSKQMNAQSKQIHEQSKQIHEQSKQIHEQSKQMNKQSKQMTAQSKQIDEQTEQIDKLASTHKSDSEFDD